MEELHLDQLPLVLEGKYLGLIFESEIDEEDAAKSLSELIPFPPKLSAQENTHCIEAVKVASEHRLQVIPVVGEKEQYEGAIHGMDLMQTWVRLTGASEPGALFVLETDVKNYSFLEIARIVEANDAQIRQLNTAIDARNESMVVTLKVNKFEITELIAAFQRNEFRIKYYFGEELYENELRTNYEHLMNYLNI